MHLFQIGVFSKITKTTIKTLRYYDEIGLLKPAAIHTDTGYRYYTTDQLFQLHQIISFRQIGLSIKEIKEILANHEVEKILQNKKTELMEQLKQNQQQLNLLDHLLKEKKEGVSMKYQVIRKELPACIVYSKKMTIPDYSVYFELIPSIGATVQKANPDLECRVPEYCFVEYLDGEYREKDIKIEFCEAVTKMGNPVEDIIFKKIEAVSAAVVLHKGPYSTLREAYSYLFQWIEDNGYEVAGNPRESYIDGIWNKESEEEWLTEIQVPIHQK